MSKNLLIVIVIFMTSCGGGEGGGITIDDGNTNINPVIYNFSSNNYSPNINELFIISWSSSAESCEASGDWSGMKGPSDNESFSFSIPGTYVFTLICSRGINSNSVNETISIYVSDGDGYASFCKSPTQDSNEYWLEEFNNNSLNSNIFTYQIGNGRFAQGIDGWGNNESQYYTGSGSGSYGDYSLSYDIDKNTTENVFIEEGYLKIQPIYHDSNLFNDPNYGNRSFTFTSGKLVTSSKKTFQHPSRITVCFKVPEGAGFWPAIWFLPQGFIEFNKSWPDDGEIDLMEARGRLPQVVGSAMHFRANWGDHHYLTSDAYVSMNNNFQDTFHSITFEWEEDSIKMYLDNEQNPFFHETSDSNPLIGTHYPFNEPFYLIFNVAVGGHFGGQNQWQNIGGVNAQYPPDNSVFCHNKQCSNLSVPDRGRFLIDYIEYKSID